MKKAFIFAALIFAVPFLVSCGSESVQNDVSGSDVAFDAVADALGDNGHTDDVVVDAGRDVLDPDAVSDADVMGQDLIGDIAEDVPISCPGNLWCPCKDNNQCYSNYCVETSGGKVCSKNCGGGGDCPRGWSCTQLVVSGDATFICTDPFARACRPCTRDSDCVPGFGASESEVYDCIPYGPGGSYCGGSCAGEDDCAEGFVCNPNPDGSGQRCMFAEGECPCSQGFIDQGYLTECYVENEYGRCKGTRTCDAECSASQPQAESCNLVDDDCDGATDEGIAGTACVNENQEGSCPGTAVCSNGVFSCSGQTPQREFCDAVDNDCDGLTDEDASNCRNFFKDGDDDGFGLSADFQCLCQASETYSAAVGNDCNDNDVNVYPGVIESCNGKDDNCDGVTDEMGAIGCTSYYLDVDNDTYGVESDKKCLCGPSGDYRATRGGDCADDNPLVSGGTAESCNGLDDDCDGQTDEENSLGCSNWYRDGDGDSFGSMTDYKCLCSSTVVYKVDVGGDCNDNNLAINPAATETCNGVDDNCDLITDDEGASGCTPYYLDNDGDQYGVGTPKCLCAPFNKYTALVDGDCSDSDGSANPGMTEVCNNKDDDCDEVKDEPGATGCTAYFLDTDRDSYGVTDNVACLCAVTGDYRATRGGDCDDANELINPGIAEKCDGLDNDCDKTVDEDGAVGCTGYYLDSDRDGYGDVANYRCLCAALAGSYDVTNASDCCDIDNLAYPGANPTVYYVGPTKCATTGREWDYDCSGTNEKEDARVNGGCEGWAVGDGCDREYGWRSSVAPACGVTAEFLTGGCGYTGIPVDCKDPVFSNRTQKCH